MENIVVCFFLVTVAGHPFILKLFIGFLLCVTLWGIEVYKKVAAYEPRPAYNTVKKMEQTNKHLYRPLLPLWAAVATLVDALALLIY